MKLGGALFGVCGRDEGCGGDRFDRDPFQKGTADAVRNRELKIERRKLKIGVDGG